MEFRLNSRSLKHFIKSKLVTTTKKNKKNMKGYVPMEIFKVIFDEVTSDEIKNSSVIFDDMFLPIFKYIECSWFFPTLTFWNLMLQSPLMIFLNFWFRISWCTTDCLAHPWRNSLSSLFKNQKLFMKMIAQLCFLNSIG